MNKTILLICFIFTVGIFLIYTTNGIAQTAQPHKEELIVTTYYPVPYGDYKELRAQRMAIGPNYYKSSEVCWGGGNCTTAVADATDLIVEGNVGVGTAIPSVNVEVAQNGAIKVGQAYFSSGGNYAHMANNEYFNGTSWRANDTPGALIQIADQNINFYRHDGHGVHTFLGQINADGDLTVQRNLNVKGSFGSSISVGGVSFCPHLLTRCYSWCTDHMTWVDNANECTGAGYVVEGQVWILMQC
jgi:hypothetical protein